MNRSTQGMLCVLISLLCSQACSEYAVCSPVELSRRSGICVSGSRLTADEWSQHGLCAQPARVHGEKTGAGEEREGKKEIREGGNQTIETEKRIGYNESYFP